MKLKSLTLSFDPKGGGFDDAELQAFQRGKEVLELRGVGAWLGVLT